MLILQSITQTAQISLYVLLALLGLFSLLVFGWQIMILRGKAMNNPDGTVDDFHEQKTHYGIAFADVILACPACMKIAGLEKEDLRNGVKLAEKERFLDFTEGRILTLDY